MSEREREMIKKMKLSAKKVEETKNPNQKPEDYLGNRITGLVAVGGYTFEQVYNMTMLQFNMLLQKYIDIQTFELRTQLSPYISSEDNQNVNKFWLD
jgi:Tfp pilus assembly PilM family ATPase